LRHRGELREQLQWSRVAWQVERELDAAVNSGRTIVVGPWLSEVGFEALYWIPFLRWVKAAFRLDPARVVAVSRGGTRSWYEGIAARYVETWEHIDPLEFARRTSERGATKQLELSPFDLEVVSVVERVLGERVAVLHPSLMYRLFSLFWSGQRPMSTKGWSKTNVSAGVSRSRRRTASASGVRPPQALVKGARGSLFAHAASGTDKAVCRPASACLGRCNANPSAGGDPSCCNDSSNFRCGA
jgi:hypothetical protein